MFEQKEKIKSYFTPDVKKKLTSWEKKFISSLYNSKKEWSSKQKEVLEKLIKKLNLVQTAIQHTITYLPYDNRIENSYIQKITTREFRRMRGINFKKNGKKK